VHEPTARPAAARDAGLPEAAPFRLAGAAHL